LKLISSIVHFYDYTKDGWDPEIYPRPRFVSEYGFQSFPGTYAWQRSKNGDDDLLALIRHRQHHPLGNIPVIALVERHLPLPLPEDDNYANALIYFSQIAQAMATKVETELYRSLRDTPHKTMGALYWQLNDVWVAPSWSGIDFYGNWKVSCNCITITTIRNHIIYLRQQPHSEQFWGTHLICRPSAVICQHSHLTYLRSLQTCCLSVRMNVETSEQFLQVQLGFSRFQHPNLEL